MRYANGLIWSLVVIVATGCTPQALGGAPGQPVHDPRDRDYSPIDEQRRNVLDWRDTIWIGPSIENRESPSMERERRLRDLILQESRDRRWASDDLENRLKHLEEDLLQAMKRFDRDIAEAHARQTAQVNAILARAHAERAMRRSLEKQQERAEQDAAAVAQPQELNALAHKLILAEPSDLFNGQDLQGWLSWSVDPKLESLWSVKSDGVLHHSGKSRGLLTTQREFYSFHLSLEWRWPEAPGNSNILLRSVGDETLWPTSICVDLVHQGAGNLFAIGRTAVRPANQAVDESDRGGQASAKHGAEREPGQWNRLDVVLNGGVATVLVNREVVSEAMVSLRSGRICLQATGTPIEFRRIRITPLD